MFVHRTLFILILIGLFFAPAINEWLYALDQGWYRPLLLWFIAIGVVAINQWRRGIGGV